MDRQAMNVGEPAPTSNDKQRVALIEWLNSTLSNVKLPINASDEDLRAVLIDGSVLCRILNKLKPGSVTECAGSDRSGIENVKRFLAAMDEMGLPRFQFQDLEKGSMKTVIECLLTLRAKGIPYVGRYVLPSTPNTPSTPIISSATSSVNDSSVRWKPLVDRYGNADASPGAEFSRSSVCFGEDKGSADSKLQRGLQSPIMSEPSAALLHHAGHKFHEMSQMKNGGYADLPPSKLSELMKSNSLDNAPTQSLLSVVNGILDESVQRKNGEIPYRVACLLRKVVQEIERRISTQAEHLRTQNNLYKAREEKYQSRIKVLEALAAGTTEETQIVRNKLQQVKTEKSIIEEKKKVEDEDVERLTKEKDDNHQEIESLKQELETVKKSYEQLRIQMDTEPQGDKKSNGAQEIASLNKELETAKKNYEQLRLQMNTDAKEPEEIVSLKQELETAKKNYEQLRLEMNTDAKKAEEIVSLKQELEMAKKSYEQLRVQVESDDKGTHEILTLKQELKIARNNHEQRCLQMETETKGIQQQLEEKLKEVESRLTNSNNRVKELETYTEARSRNWNKKKHIYLVSTELQLGTVRELKVSSQAIRQEITRTQKSYLEEFSHLGKKFKVLENAAENYYSVLAENQKMHNELQELKGNIRVYCRIRPFLPGQKGKQSIVEHVGDNGELTVANPSKQGKESQRSFKFNKVYDPAATQANVYSDTRPLIQSVLDGYNVCIFAYGQTGSGKTYTMMGPDNATEEDWGVNYRALNDLFNISQKRTSTYNYEIGVQMVEIYNEQVRDLLASGGAPKKLGIVTASQSSGLAVPDASMQTVQSTSDVLDLMEIGFRNRAKGSTAMNERSSRSHSVLTVHVRGTDLKTGALLRGSLHLVDLAGSERIDRSEATGDRLKEAQHINKSLSALGDVIFALAQKSSHVPYRNSKLTQVLQSSLGGQAKTLMLVQLNPDVTSFTESLSTLKFAERVSGVELGAAKSSKESKDVRELMEQVISLKDTISKKEDEIERLQLLKDTKNVNINGEKRASTSTRYGSSPSVQNSTGSTPRRAKSLRAASDQDNCTDNNDKNSAASTLQHSKSLGGNEGQNSSTDAENLEYDDGEYEEQSRGISGGGVSIGTENEASLEGTPLPEDAKQSDTMKRLKPSTVKSSRPALKSSNQKSTANDTTKALTGLKKSPSGNSLSVKSTKRWA